MNSCLSSFRFTANLSRKYGVPKLPTTHTHPHTHTHTHTQIEVCFKKLAHVIVKTGRPETSRVGGKLENPGRVCVAALTLEALKGRVPLSLKELSVFS